MPVVKIEFDKAKVSEGDIKVLARTSHEIVSSVTGIKDVPVYARSADFTAEIAPIEIFIELSAHKITNPAELKAQLRSAYEEWKKTSEFIIPINMTLIPMTWNIEIGI